MKKNPGRKERRANQRKLRREAGRERARENEKRQRKEARLRKRPRGASDKESKPKREQEENK